MAVVWLAFREALALFPGKAFESEGKWGVLEIFGLVLFLNE